MKKTLVLLALMPLAAGAQQIRLCDDCPEPPPIDLSLPNEIMHHEIQRVLNDVSWLASNEAAEANRLRAMKFDTVLMSINVPILQRFEFMAKIWQVVIDDYRGELARAELDMRNTDNSDDPTGFMHQAALKFKGKKPDFKKIIAEKRRAIERCIESRNKEMGELAEQVK